MTETLRYPRRRQVERIRLGIPLRGRFGTAEVVVLDLSLLGCRVEHSAPLRTGATMRLSIDVEGGLEMECTVVRCTLDPVVTRGESTVYQSGLRFVRGLGDASQKLRTLITRQVADALEQQKANARGELPTFVRMALEDDATVAVVERATSLPYLRVARARGYMTYTLDRNVWRKRRSQNASQPPEGFTVWAYEDEQQLDLLAKTYEKASDELRTLIRLCAELSLVADDTIPPQRFLP